MPLTLSAPAKINLSLRVLRRREDGFHEIESLMTTLPGLADKLRFTEADAFGFSCSDGSLDTGEGNLVVKAVRAFEQASGQSCRCRIHLEKHIPHGAGLGGGSSDAALTLRGLNQWHDEPLDAATLHRLAAILGSDVPFFLLDGPGWARGRGEKIEAAEPHPILPLLLLKPSFGVATPDAYRRWRCSEWLPGLDRSGERELEGIRLVNDLERPVFSKHRFLAELVDWLEDQAETRAAQLCGSGSTTFAILSDLEAGNALAKRARAELEPNLWHWIGTTA